MNKKNLELLGLKEGATAGEIKEAYERLREKYLEDRFLDGEEGNNAAKMLTKIETAYQELCSELNEDATAGDGGESFEKVEELIKAQDFNEAQRVLDAFNERPARWHYLQSVVFYRKNWMNESKKQLEIAIQLEPDNEKYKEAYRKLNDKLNHDSREARGGARPSDSAPDGGQGDYQNNYQSNYQGQDMNSQYSQDQMGGTFCENCLNCCYTYMCVSCLCDGCCR